MENITNSIIKFQKKYRKKLKLVYLLRNDYPPAPLGPPG